MKLIVLTNGSRHGLEIIHQLKNANINIQSIILEKKELRKKELNLLKSKLGKGAFIVDLIPFKNNFYRIFRKFKYNDISAKTLRNYSKTVHEISNLTGKKCEAILNQVAPDILVLGGCRILKDNILDIPKIGTLNAHPGILPYYRGVDVIKWALYNEDKIGVTIHFVDSKIDSGPICAQEEIQLKKNCSIQWIKEEAIKTSGRIMCNVVSDIIKFKKISTFPNDINKGNYYTSMPKEKDDELMIKLANNEQ